MIDVLCIKQNLDLLFTTDPSQLAVEESGIKLRVRAPNEKDQAKLREVIEETFAFASKDEDADHRLWVKVRADDTTVTYASPGHVLEVVKRTFPDLRVERALLLEEETEEKVELILAGESFYADKRALIESSEMLEKLFTGGFAEEAKKGIELQPPDYLTDFVNDKNFKVAVASLQGEPLPEGVDVNDYIELALIFDYFEAKDLREGSCRVIANAELEPEELLTLRSCPTNLFLDVVCQIDTESFMALYFHVQDVLKTGVLGCPFGEIVVSRINKEKLVFPSFQIEDISQFLDFLGESASSLTYVNIKGMPLTNEEFGKLLENCPNILELSVPKVASGDALKHLVHARKLRVLNLVMCNKLKRNILKYLIYTPELQSLSLVFCYQLERDILKHLVYTPELQSLDIGFCGALNLNVIPQKLRHLAPQETEFLPVFF